MKPGNLIKEVEGQVDPKLNSVLGWVPFLKDQTSIIVYHFFSTNYLLRKQALIRLSIVNQDKVVCQKLFWFPAYSVCEFELKKTFGNIDGNSAFVEMFHPFIRKNHASHDGHLRAWGKYYSLNNELRSTVHTAPLSKSNIFSARFIQPRNYFPINFKGKCYHFSRSLVEIDKDRNSKLHEGFNVYKDENNNPRSVWHHGGVVQVKKPINSNSKKITLGFWCPPSKKIDPRIAIDDLETGIRGANPIEIFIVKDSKIIKKKKFDIDDFFQSTISNIFNEFVPGPYYVLATFYVNFDFSYLHVNYDTIDNCGDNIHSHECQWIVEGGEVKPIEIKGNNSARKFIHFSKTDEQNQYYLIIHTNKIKGITNPKLKIRIYTDNKKEYLKLVDLTCKEPMEIFKLKELFPNITENINKCGVLQIESSDDNFPASLLYFNSQTEETAVDHLTGG